MTDAAQPENPDVDATNAAPPRHPLDNPLRRFIEANRAPLGTFAVLVVMMAVFIAANPHVFLEWNIYRSVLTTLPVALFLVVPLVFVVTAGEIDLSFPATMGFSAWMFALVVQAGFNPYIGLAAAMATGALLGFFVGALVVYFRLSSLIATLGMNFMLRGVIQIATEGKSIALVSLSQSSAKSIFSGVVFGVPTQMFWALAFIVFSSLLFNRNQFGAHVKIVGDNSDSAQQMGIDVNWVRVKAFIFVGLGAALAGFFSTMINFTWWPTSGDGYLLPALASVFVGGTPTWGGVGTVTGGAIGALIALAIMGAPFGFMAFLGIASLIGVIVSHVIVLFDFIEEMHEKGEPLERALPDAGIQRIRPVMITVGATILALFPLALEGGPLWQPLCYAQIGGLAVATFITLLLVPVFYSIFVFDLKWIKWEVAEKEREEVAAVH